MAVAAITVIMRAANPIFASGATLDEDFARDLASIIAERRPLDAPEWD
jgi:hypothetical protein